MQGCRVVLLHSSSFSHYVFALRESVCAYCWIKKKFFLKRCVLKNVFIYCHTFGNVHGHYWTWFQAGVQWMQSHVSSNIAKSQCSISSLAWSITTKCFWSPPIHCPSTDYLLYYLCLPWLLCPCCAKDGWCSTSSGVLLTVTLIRWQWKEMCTWSRTTCKNE